MYSFPTEAYSHSSGLRGAHDVADLCRFIRRPKCDNILRAMMAMCDLLLDSSSPGFVGKRIAASPGSTYARSGQSNSRAGMNECDWLGIKPNTNPGPSA